MVGASKILTVSYGTFSCTLEGFDEPFSTMKAIAEYFRDLAADDRYFGAEPPTPDAEMLHKIAEREIHRRVEAKINANGIVLRPEGAQDTLSGAVDDTPALRNTSRDITVTGASNEELVARGIPARAATVQSASVHDLPLSAIANAVMQDPSVDVPAQDPAQVAADVQAVPAAVRAVQTALPEAQVAETVAAKLQRIRTAVAEARAREAAAPAFTEDQHADPYYRANAPDEAVIESDFGFDLDITGPIEQEEDEPDATPSDVIETAQSAKDMPSSEKIADERPDDSTDGSTAVVSDTADVARQGRTFRIEPKVTAAEPVVSEIGFDSQQDGETETDDARMERRALRRAARAEAAATAQADADETERNAQAEAEAQAQAQAEADADAARLADEIAQNVAVTPIETDEPVAPRIRARVIKVRRSDVEEAAAAFAVDDHVAHESAEIPLETLATDAQSDDPTEASIKAVLAAAAGNRSVGIETPAPVRTTPILTTDHEDDSREDEALLAAIGAELGRSDTAPASHLTFEDEDDLAAELAELERGWDDTSGEEKPIAQTTITEAVDTDDVSHPALESDPTRDGKDEEDVSRLMREANSKLEGAENRRRFSAIAHLKAAVAATVADRKIRATEGKPETDEVDTTEPYRDDLTRAVRPRRPAIAGAATPRPNVAAVKAAPLVLVSEQRVDETPARFVEPVRPRRISAAELTARLDADVEEEEDDLDASPEEASDFADFAERLGATGLADLLEAAAAFSEGVEGRPHFSRPQIIRKVAALTGQARYDREAGLRSFGTLLREGKIAKVKRGQFAITEQSRFYKEARRAGA